MVTALTSTRLISAQLALKALQADDTTDDSSSPDSSSLGSSISNDISSLPSSAQASLASMLNSLSSDQSDDTTATSADSASTTTASTDITTDSFMALLKQNLTATAAGSSDGAKQAQAMLDALAAGTLTVSDPTNGVSITAWDPTATTSTDTSDSSDTSDTAANSPTSIPVTDWNDYLKAHLQRNTDGTLTRAADNSFIDKSTGNEAYFGQVGTQFYYLSWSDADSTDAAATTATDAASA